MVDSTGTTKASPSTNGHAEVAEKEDLNPIKAP
jgi:hypothetical protein